jgi:molybdopterin-guanine dinucleotide biosynthesis protein A
MSKLGSDCRGFVLVGGNSSRMGRDKATLPFGDRPLVVWMAELARRVCDTVSLVGNRRKYAGLGFPMVEDVFPDQGPMGGIHAALENSSARWNLVVGCDMPYLPAAFLRRLLGIAQEADADAVVPESNGFQYEPLCAVYARACLAPVEAALRAHRRKISDVFEQLRLRSVPRDEWKPFNRDGRLFQNLNTPQEYEQARAELLAGAGSMNVASEPRA